MNTALSHRLPDPIAPPGLMPALAPGLIRVLLTRALLTRALLTRALLTRVLLILVLLIPGNGLADPLYLQAGGARLIKLKSPASNVFVANPKVADVQVKSPRLIYLYGREAGETTIFAVDGQDRVLLNRNVVVGANIDHLNSSLRTLFPAASVRASMVNQSLMLTGEVTKAADADQIRRLALQYVDDEKKLFDRTRLTRPNQVTLHVRVAEVSREITKQLGVNWNFTKSVGGIALGLVTANPAAALIPNALSVARTGSLSFQAVVDALDEQGLISILAEPNLTAVSGEEASFLAGGEFPILVPRGNGEVVVEFKQYGVQLKFTPTVMDSNRINLRVNPEVSQLSANGAVEIAGFQIPSLTTRRTDTTVEMASGQSLAIAGFLQRDSEHDINKFPGLGDVPVLGALFRSDAFQRKETELVIIVTPYIASPVEPLRMAAPTDGFRLPHDRERLLNGAQWRDSADVGNGVANRPDPALDPALDPGTAVVAQLGGEQNLRLDLSPHGPRTVPTASALPANPAPPANSVPPGETAPPGDGPSLIGPIGFEFD